MLQSIGKRFLNQECKVLVTRYMSTSTVRLQQDGSEERLLISVKDGVKRITLNDRKKHNALSLSLIEELSSALVDSSNDENVQVIILGHTGSAFSVGHDLKELQEKTGSEYHTKIFQRCSNLMNLVQDISVPVIAEVKGFAVAAGCQLVASCDLAVSSEGSTFGVPGVTLGLFCTTPGVALARSVNRKQALKMLLTGDNINAEEALRCGLVNDVVPAENLTQTTDNLAARITRHSRPVISLGKETFYKQIKETRDDAYCLAENVMVENLKHADSQEGIDAFLTKRKPKWT